MQALPHDYRVLAAGTPTGNVSLEADSLPSLSSAPPAQFGGPGDQWSPESLLIAAVADCFVLGFRAIAQASRFDWEHVQCDAEGTLDRVDGSTLFTSIRLKVELRVPAGTDPKKAQRLLSKAERTCLITSSLKADVELSANVTEA